MTLPRACGALAATLLLALSVPAGAQTPQGEEDAVSVGGSLDLRLRFDRLGRRGDRAQGNLYTKSEAALYANLPAGFTVNGVFKLEQAGRDRTPADTAFVDQALWVDQLYLSWAQGPVELTAGKIHPRFGFAWDKAPGLFGKDVAEDGYELTEKLGVGAGFSWSDALDLANAIGDHDVKIEVFRADRSALSGSIGARRWFIDPGTGQRTLRRNGREVGGADNTSGFRNVVVSAEGTGVPLPVGTLDYTLGASLRKAGADSVAAGTDATERGLVGGLAWEVPVGWRVTATPLVEIVRLENANGVRGQDRNVATVGVSLERRPYTVAFTWARQRDAGPTDATVRQPAASVTYDLGDAIPALDGVEWTVGWRRVTASGERANDYGTMLAYGIKF